MDIVRGIEDGLDKVHLRMGSWAAPPVQSTILKCSWQADALLCAGVRRALCCGTPCVVGAACVGC